MISSLVRAGGQNSDSGVGILPYKYLLGGAGGGLVKSDDLVNFTAIDLQGMTGVGKIKRIGNRVFVLGESALLYTYDGVSWTKVVPSGITDTFRDIEFAFGKYFITGVNKAIYTTVDFTSFTTISLFSATSPLRNIIYFGSALYIFTRDISSTVIYSTDGATWQNANVSTSAYGYSSPFIDGTKLSFIEVSGEVNQITSPTSAATRSSKFTNVSGWDAAYVLVKFGDYYMAGVAGNQIFYTTAPFGSNWTSAGGGIYDWQHSLIAGDATPSIFIFGNGQAQIRYGTTPTNTTLTTVPGLTGTVIGIFINR